MSDAYSRQVTRGSDGGGSRGNRFAELQLRFARGASSIATDRCGRAEQFHLRLDSAWTAVARSGDTLILKDEDGATEYPRVK